MKTYINVGEFTFLFIIRILIIVAGSWGLIFLAEEINRRIHPSLSKRVFNLVDEGKKPE
jgi:hypothetical protein